MIDINEIAQQLLSSWSKLKGENASYLQGCQDGVTEFMKALETARTETARAEAAKQSEEADNAQDKDGQSAEADQQQQQAKAE